MFLFYIIDTIWYRYLSAMMILWAQSLENDKLTQQAMLVQSWICQSYYVRIICILGSKNVVTSKVIYHIVLGHVMIFMDRIMSHKNVYIYLKITMRSACSWPYSGISEVKNFPQSSPWTGSCLTDSSHVPTLNPVCTFSSSKLHLVNVGVLKS